MPHIASVSIESSALRSILFISESSECMNWNEVFSQRE